MIGYALYGGSQPCDGQSINHEVLLSKALAVPHLPKIYCIVISLILYIFFRLKRFLTLFKLPCALPDKNGYESARDENSISRG